MSKPIRIGTRDSELALWQAHTVERSLNNLGYETEIVAVKATGDIILDVPLYELGITGIFTKTLDIAMLKGEIDVAVHSMKDVPTSLPKGIVQAAVPERADVSDILVHKGSLEFLHTTGTIATGSLRRQAQWLNRYPNHKVEDLRGNVNTRLKKLKDNNWNGAVFAAAGLKRINLLPENHTRLDWMIPAPAQGAMMAVAMEQDDFCREALSRLNHKPSDVATHIERQFLKKLEGGCTAPIGALATFTAGGIRFEGILLSIDGKEKIHIETFLPDTADYADFGNQCAEAVLQDGGTALMADIRQKLGKDKQ